MSTHPFARRFVLTALTLLLAGLLPPEAGALHREAPGTIRLTSGVDHAHQPTRSWGRFFAFSSTEDLTGLGAARAAGAQVFVFDLLQYTCQRGTPEVTTDCSVIHPFLVQVTNNPGDPQNPSVSDLDINANQYVAFDALGSFNGGSGTQATRRQIFVKNIVTGQVTQVTQDATGDSIRPSVSSLAGIIVFESTKSSAVSQVWLYERDDNILRQITDGAAPSTGPIPNKSGIFVSFQSAAALLGDGSDTGIEQVFWIDYDRQQHQVPVGGLHQLTNGNAPSMHPSIGERPAQSGAKMNFIAFDSAATDLPGVPPGGPGTQIYTSTFIDQPGTPPTLSKITTGSQGDCFTPDINPQGDHIVFKCTGNAQQEAQFGKRVYYWAQDTGAITRVEASFDVNGPIGAGLGQWFATFAAPTDRMGTGFCGVQLHVVNYFSNSGAGGTNVIGLRNFELEPGTALGGSKVRVTTTAGTQTSNLTGQGRIALQIGAPNIFTGETTVDVPRTAVMLPPLPVPNVGAMCVTATADGHGNIDCNGGRVGADAFVTQDHSREEDVNCDFGCREDDIGCGTSVVPGPHRIFCPTCFQGECVGGIFDGESCLNDTVCRPGLTCEDGTIAMCNGQPFTDVDGTYDAGGVLFTLPISVRLSLATGPDNTFCTIDDTYSTTTFDTADFDLRLTTGGVLGAIEDANAVKDTVLAVPAVGTPFTCDRLKKGDLTGARLVGVLPFLDLPKPPGIKDVLLTLDLKAKASTDALCTADCTNDTDCNDGDLCNGTETCNVATGDCQPGTPVSCSDGNACNGFETCNPADGQCRAGTPPACDDGNPCNGAETCQAATGACLPGTPLVCSDGNVCNGIETCNPANGQCQAGPPLQCGDLDPCNGQETCNPVTGQCQAGIPLQCDDGNVCTQNFCTVGIGCQKQNLSGVCNDNNPCTQTDQCVAGVCTGTPTVCSDGNACNGVETCNPANGQCVPGSPPNCEDNNPCTQDLCNPAGGCTHTPTSGICTDNNLCTSGDTCVNGTCTGTPTSCSNGNACDGVETCNPANGSCQSGTPVVCSDNNACNGLETCNPANGSCIPGVAVNCSDGNACNGDEVCNPISGQCQPGQSPNCNDNNPCTTDGCSPTGGCTHTPTAGQCNDSNNCTENDFCDVVTGGCTGTPKACASDGNACNGTETCDPGSGICVSPGQANCNDNNPCTDDSCNQVNGQCVFTPRTNGVSCNDGLTCTTSDICLNGTCTGTPTVCTDNNACNGLETCDPSTGLCRAGSPPGCDDGNPCTTDSCNPSVGCQFVNNQSTCNDGDVCTVGDLCRNGNCIGTPVACSNGDLCDGEETCDPATGACRAGNDLACDDGSVCTIETCDGRTGCVSTPVADFVTCRLLEINGTLGEILAQLRRAPRKALGGPGKVRQLKRLVQGARKKLKAAGRKPARAARNLQRVQRRLGTFVVRVDQGIRSLVIDPTVGVPLRNLATGAVDQVVTLRTNVI